MCVRLKSWWKPFRSNNSKNRTCHCFGRARQTSGSHSALLARPKQCRVRPERRRSAGQAVARHQLSGCTHCGRATQRRVRRLSRYIPIRPRQAGSTARASVVLRGAACRAGRGWRCRRSGLRIGMRLAGTWVQCSILSVKQSSRPRRACGGRCGTGRTCRGWTPASMRWAARLQVHAAVQLLASGSSVWHASSRGAFRRRPGECGTWKQTTAIEHPQRIEEVGVSRPAG